MNEEVLKKIKPCVIDRPFVFVSYSAKDREVVYRDVYELQLRGWNVWLDERNLDKTNESWKKDALEAIEEATCRVGLFYVSKDSLCSENCYNEIKQTKSSTAIARHFNHPVKFIAVEVNEITDIVKFGEEVTVQLAGSHLSKGEKNRRTEIVTYFVHDLFKGNNERVRIKPRATYLTEDDYYNAIEEQFDKAKLERTEPNNLARIKQYRSTLDSMAKASTEQEYSNVAEQLKSFIGTFTLDQIEEHDRTDFDLCYELQDAIVQKEKCETRLKQFQEITYQKAIEELNQVNSKEDFDRIAKDFEKLKGYKYSEVKAKEARGKAEECRKEEIYTKAIASMQAGTKEGYLEAIKVFKTILGFRDVETRIKECQEKVEILNDDKYVKAIEAMTNAKTYEQFTDVSNMFRSLKGFKDSNRLAALCENIGDEKRKCAQSNRLRTLVDMILVVAIFLVWFGVGCRNAMEPKTWLRTEMKYFSDVNKGDIVFFGSYEQDNNIDNGLEPIEWIVLNKEKDGTLFLISKYALDCKCYNEYGVNITWKGCTLRIWLNGDFYRDAFNKSEKEMILESKIKNDDNSDFGTEGGEDTKDKVFLLSIGEASNEDLFLDNESRKCIPTPYAVAKGPYVNDDLKNCWWWLRSPGYESDEAACVDIVGSLITIGIWVDESLFAVRPSLRIHP